MLHRMGVGNWGLGIGHWALGIGNCLSIVLPYSIIFTIPHSPFPIPYPQAP
ncbi:MAG: hypothetical protein V7L11_09730 [Nostoc sp.]|uniref:hypothetical protein n=1 Tax=Nostoc sp. TaxID=1180 RepID=UPI002FFB6E50